MALTKITDVRSKSPDELNARLAELRKEQFNLRVQRATGQLSSPARFGHVRREIAQILTILNEKRRASAKAA